MEKRILLGSIIAVAILILIPTTSSVNFQEDKQKENKLVDSTTEIISFISSSRCFVDRTQGDVGIIRNIEFWELYGTVLHLTILASNPLQLIFWAEPDKIEVPLFIGYAVTTFEPGVFRVRGVALGNIKWWEW